MPTHTKPRLLKGTRDFGAEELYKRKYLLHILEKTYQHYGFLPLETPALEQLSTLTNTYGQEGDQLVFKVLNSGNFLAHIPDTAYHQGYQTLLPHIAKKGLRYDLTVPLMRYVVMHHANISFPFRRYQMQPVWRADRPQQGRYQEFYQCDIDIVGTTSLICEAEILKLVHDVLDQVGLHACSIQLNHRALLQGIAQCIGAVGQEERLSIALDKLDKIGQEKVMAELVQHGFNASALEKLTFIFALQGTNQDRLALLERYIGHCPVGHQGLQALRQILQYVAWLGLAESAIVITPTLARGLAYYTGAIFELKVHTSAIGSIGGGGRYDNLTGSLGLPGVSGVGFSFGLDRLYEVLAAHNLFPPMQEATPQVLVTHMDVEPALRLLATLRAHAIPAEIYPEPIALKKQLHYAHKKKIPFVLFIGTEEQATHQIRIKNMQTGIQQQGTLAEVLAMLTVAPCTKAG